MRHDAPVRGGNPCRDPGSPPLPADVALELLTAARHDLAAGRTEAALRAVNRALRLPWDHLVDADTAVNEAHLMFHCAVTDALEESEVGDSAWLQAVEIVLATCGEHARNESLRTLRLIDRDYGVDDWDRQRIRRRLAPGGGQVAGIDDSPARTSHAEPERRQMVLELLTAQNTFLREFVRRGSGHGG